jgi:hypothetical protein
MPHAGYLSTVYVGGTPVATTNVVLTKLAADAPKGIPADSWYRIVDPTRRIIDPSATITVDVDADGGGAGAYATVAATTYTVDALGGIVKFITPNPTVANVRISYSYMPQLALIGAYEASVSLTNADLDATVFSSTGLRTHQLGLQDGEMTFATWEVLDTDHDPAGTTRKLEDVLMSRQTVVVEFNPTGIGTGETWRMWGVATTGEEALSMEDLVKSSITFKLVSRQLTSRPDVTGLSLSSG